MLTGEGLSCDTNDHFSVVGHQLVVVFFKLAFDLGFRFGEGLVEIVRRSCGRKRALRHLDDNFHLSPCFSLSRTTSQSTMRSK